MAGKLKEMPNPADSGARLLFTNDGKYVLKTIKQDELDSFLRFSIKYHRRITESGESFLMKIVGIYVHANLAIDANSKIIIMVMLNILPFDRKIKMKFDLKGFNSDKRIVSPVNTFYDLDVQYHRFLAKRHPRRRERRTYRRSETTT